MIIICLWSDQCSVNGVVNFNLKAIREELLPTVIENWNGLGSDNQKSLSEMGHYFCRIHLLVNMATECNKVLGELEEITCSSYNINSAIPQSGESGAGRLTRTAVKSFHPRGCEKSGIAPDFMTYLANAEKVLKLVPFKGNRFNFFIL